MKIFNIKPSPRKSGDSGADAPKGKKRTAKQSIIRWMWISFLGTGFIIATLLLLIYNGVIGYMPPIEELEDPHDKLASVIYAGDGTTEMGRYFEGAGNRTYSDYKDVSPHVIDALIATEDVRFESHSGIDFRSLARSVIKTILMRDKSSGGGSTITQQLAKQLYSQPSTNIFKRALQKPIEWMIAIKLERFYTKEEIINMYLNRFDFLNNAVGIKTAANVYFGKEPSDLNVEEAAMLVGMLKNPSYYNPLRYEDRVRQRRNVVIDQMVKAGKLPATEADSIKKLPLGLDYHRVDHKEGEAPYLREEIRRLMTATKPKRPNRSDYGSSTAYTIALSAYRTDSVQWEENPLCGWIEKNPKPDGSHYNLYQDGLRIYTTIDLKMQKYAEEAVYQHLGGTLQPAFTAEKRGSKYGPYSTNNGEISGSTLQGIIDKAIKQTARYRSMKEAGASETEIKKAFKTPYSMEVFAWVKKNGHYEPGTKTVTMSPRDSLMYMKSILRTGMIAMDPVTGYVKAYVGGPDFNYFQYDMASRGKRQIGSTSKPFLYTLAMEQGKDPCSSVSSFASIGGWTPRGSRAGSMTLKQALTSSNNGVSANLLNELGVPPFIDKLRMFGITSYIESNVTISLGSYDAPVSEMVSAYSTFANHGIRVNPVYVSRIEDNQGNVIYSANAHRTEVTSSDACDDMVMIMMNVVNNGTARALRSAYNISAEMGGKTGTTNNNSDAWYMGYTPQIVVGVWVGGEERYIHFNNSSIGQGARSALPIFGIFMQKLFADKSLPYRQDIKFEFPEGYMPCDGAWGDTYQPAAPAANDEVPEDAEDIEGMFD